MYPHHLGRTLALAAPVAFAAVLAVSTEAQVRPSRQDAETMKQKVAAIQAHGEQPSKQPRRTTVTEGEVNSYIAYELTDTLPAGVVNPSVTAPGDGRVSGRAVVDLDAVRKAGKSTGLLDLRSYLTGSVPVTAAGVIRATNGVGRFELESATVGGVPIPKWLLQEIISHYSKSPEHPAGISLDDPFELPARIREIQVQRGLAIVVQ
jgi:hypothetical protein